MFGFILRRLAVAIPTLLLLIVLSFLLMYAAPGGPFTQERALPPQVLANLNAKYGLNDPLWRQIVNYVWGIVAHFDFGPSFVYPDRTVNQIIAAGFPITLTYGAIAFVVAVSVGVTLGVTAAIRQNTWLDYFAVGLSIGAQVLPNFVMAPILVLVFTLWLGWLPGGGWGGPIFWIMPVIALSTSFMASIARITRSSMLEVLRQDYIRTAKAKGLPHRKVVLKHALSNALIPIVTVVGIIVSLLLSGAVVTEALFSIPGMGQLLTQAVLSRDYPMVQGGLLLVTTFLVMVNITVDTLYAVLDPRVRYE